MTQSEKMEIITLVEQSPLRVKATLRELGIHRSTFYEWYKRYLSNGFDGLADQPYRRTSAWNQLPSVEKSRIVELAFERPDLSCRELACHIVDNEGWFVSESTVYRILKSRGLITTPAYRLMEAADHFYNPTTAPNQLWQTDFTYFKIKHWGWYYLSTVLDDYSRYILAWDRTADAVVSGYASGRCGANGASRSASQQPNYWPAASYSVGQWFSVRVSVSEGVFKRGRH